MFHSKEYIEFILSKDIVLLLQRNLSDARGYDADDDDDVDDDDYDAKCCSLQIERWYW